jgi:Lsr2
MVRRITQSLVDDLDGRSAAHETVEFEIDGVSYQIDLSSKNARRLRKDLGKWIAASRRVGGRRKRSLVAAARMSSSPDESRAIREWARRRGLEIGLRGRIPAEIIGAYHSSR